MVRNSVQISQHPKGKNKTNKQKNPKVTTMGNGLIKYSASVPVSAEMQVLALLILQESGIGASLIITAVKFHAVKKKKTTNAHSHTQVSAGSAFPRRWPHGQRKIT